MYAWKSNIVNVPDALIFSPHFRDFHLFFPLAVSALSLTLHLCYTANTGKKQVKKPKQVKKHGTHCVSSPFS